MEIIDGLLKKENVEKKPNESNIIIESNMKNEENKNDQIENSNELRDDNKIDLNSQKPVNEKNNDNSIDSTKTSLLGIYQINCLKTTELEQFLQKIELIRNILEQIMPIFGDIYEFSENYFFNVLYQALEVVVYNGYPLDKFENMTELFLYQLILTSFREDHQILFSFYYSLYFLKETGQHNKLLWNFFIQGPIESKSQSTWFQNPKIQEHWENLKHVLLECFKITDGNLPALHIENKDFVEIKIKREKDESSPNNQKKNINDKYQSSNSVGMQSNNNSISFFPTETNIVGNESKKIIKRAKIAALQPKINNEYNSEENINILTRRKNLKSQTLMVNIPQKKSKKNMDGKNELCTSFGNINIIFISFTLFKQ